MTEASRLQATATLRCRSCYSPELEAVLSLGDQHLSSFIGLEETIATPAYPLVLYLCRQCSLLQLGAAVPKDLLYGQDYGYKSGISETIRNDLADIARQAQRARPLRDGEIVLDIGCNDGTLLELYPHSVQRVGIDPLDKLEPEVTAKGITFINDFFNAAAFQNELGSESKAAIITAISMFYDLEDPNEFIRDILKILQDDGIFIVQQNYLVTMIENNAFDNICHEHLEYYALATMEDLLSRHGLMVFDAVVNDINGGSIRTLICRQGTRPVSDRVRAIAKSEPNLLDLGYYEAFVQRCDTIKQQVVTFIKNEVSQGRVVYALGASTRGNTLLQYFGLDKDFIGAAMERNPEKYDRKIASVGIPIVSEDEARKEAPDYFLVLPWHFKQQIIERESAYLATGGKLVFPLSQPSIVSRDGEQPLP